MNKDRQFLIYRKDLYMFADRLEDIRRMKIHGFTRSEVQAAINLKNLNPNIELELANAIDYHYDIEEID